MRRPAGSRHRQGDAGTQTEPQLLELAYQEGKTFRYFDWILIGAFAQFGQYRQPVLFRLGSSRVYANPV
jgi:hypothetical protein